MIEFLLEVFGELCLQAVAEALVELGFHALAEFTRDTRSPWVAALGCALIGALLGGLSLWVFPASLVAPVWRLPNLLFTPVLVGALMVAMGAWRAQRGQAVLRIDRFAYGYLFALSLALVRFFLVV